MVKTVNLTINNINVSVPYGTTILKAAKENGINIPTLCYLEKYNDIGACRVCIVELEGVEQLVASCNTVCEEGMVVKTNSPKVRSARKDVVEMILSQHDCLCATCVRSGNCALQNLANDLGILESKYEKKFSNQEWNTKFPLIRDAKKCIKCMRCIQICDKMQTVNVWDVASTGGYTDVDVAGGKSIDETKCTLCGQCITHCPTGALRIRDDRDLVLEAIADPEVVTVVQVAPAVRSAWAEYWTDEKDLASPGRMVAAIKKLGFDYVFDTDFSADLTIMEEGSELIERIKSGKKFDYPLFTSCCPGWVRFIKGQFEDMTDSLSTAKSPQQMFGAVTKSYFAEKIGVDPHKIFCVSIMPCTAKKMELTLPDMDSACGDRDVDASLTTRELIRMLRADNLNPASLKEEEFDSPLGTATGAGVIFGATGGVMEAALRSAYYLVTGKNPDADAFKEVRGMDGWKEATFEINGIKLKVAVASGLGNARKLIEAIRAKEVSYDFVEIMACPGGCAGGGGQPIKIDTEMAEERGRFLYTLDANAKLRFSHENPSVAKIYEEYFTAPLSEKAHHLLHANHESWQMPK